MKAYENIYTKYLTDEKGLSTTSATYIANVAKEYIANKEAQLENITFYNTFMELLSEGKNVQTGIGVTDETVNAFVNKLSEIAEMKTLCAWIWEAVKAKEDIIRAAKGIDMETWYEETTGNKWSDLYASYNTSYVDPKLNRTLAEQVRYIKDETYAAVFGKFIHPRGSFHNARKALHVVNTNPITVEGTGQDRVIVNKAASVSPDVIENTYMSIQKQWREFEASVNRVKYKEEQEENNNTLERSNESAKYLALYKEYTEKHNAWKTAEVNRLSKLKIVIPAELESIYLFVESLGKKDE